MTILTDQEILNNGIRASGGEDFRRDEEFRQLNPPFRMPSLPDWKSCLWADGGATDAFAVWQEKQLLLDGYNRASICERLGLSFTIRRVSLPDREAAKTWILRHQAGRRNLTPDGAA